MADKIFIGTTTTGKGVHAKRPIEAGETIFYLTGKLITFDEAVSIPQGEYSVQVGIDRYIDPYSPARYLNHSCEPNAGFMDEIRLVAVRPIKPGDHITFDYSTTMLERCWELDCACGTRTCRGRIRDFDLIPAALQARYLRMGIVQDFIIAELDSVRELAKRAA